MKLSVNITPVPLARPRINTGNKGRYLPKRSQQFKEDFQAAVRAAFTGKPFENPLSVTLHFFKPLKITAPNYGDVDNLQKAVLDAGNGLIWADDRQITELHGYKHKGTGKIEIEVSECC